jgi:hypothetical protein
MEDYVRLLWRMSSLKDKMFAHKSLLKATSEARQLFASKNFRNVLDGALAEAYVPKSKKLESEIKH